MRATFAFSIALLAMLVLSPRPAAATAITYDFSGTFEHGPYLDPTNKTITGQFTIDFDTQTITGFDFQAPSGEISPSQWWSQLFTYTPAVSPADNFVHLVFGNGDGTLSLLFRTTLAAFDGSTFYPGSIDLGFGTTGSGLSCNYTGPICSQEFGSGFVSGAAAPHTTQPPVDPSATVPEPMTVALVGSGLVGIAYRRRPRPSVRQ